MKKIITIICVIFIVVELSAQEHFLKLKKSLSSRIIGTSANAYTALNQSSNWLDVDPISSTILFTHRQGGAWGGSSTNLYCKFSNDYSFTWDSIEFVYTSGAMFRYPNCVVYNPSSNLNSDSLFALVSGPCTNGGGWVSNYFGSQKLTGENNNMEYLPQISIDSTILTMINLCKGADKFHIAAKVINNISGDILKYIVYNGVFNQILKKVDWTSSEINTFFRKRTFSNTTVNWVSNPNLAFDNFGLHGFFFTFGADSLDDPYFTSIPIVWETTDGGVTWTKQIYYHFDKIQSIRNKIFPTIESYTNSDTLQWIYRPDFPCGTITDDSNFPGVVDIFGNLHIATIIEGRPSYHQDSLNVRYVNQPYFLFDIIKNDTGWTAVFIDTIKSDIPNPYSAGFPYAPENPYDWDHWLKITKTSDGSKIFVLWTDTDPNLDSVNLSPEIKAWGFDVTNNTKTLPTLFTTGNGNIMCLQVPDIIFVDGMTYKIPCTYIDPFSSGGDILLPVNHYFLNGVEFNESDFIPVNNDKNSQNEISIKVYPNPFSNQVQISYQLSQASELSIEVYNSIGEKIKIIFQGRQYEGIYNELLNLNVVGIYYIKFTLDKVIKYSKIIKIK